MIAAAIFRALRTDHDERKAADAALVKATVAGDAKAFDELYELNVDRVHAQLTRLVGPVADREDLVQQAFMQLYRALPSFRGDSALSTFLHRITVNVAYQYLRQRKRRPETALADQDLERLLAQDMTPEERAEQTRRLKQAFELLDRIKPKKRIAFLLRVVEGLSLAEVGLLVDAKPAAVGQRVKHAQRELETMLARIEKGRGRS